MTTYLCCSKYDNISCGWIQRNQNQISPCKAPFTKRPHNSITLLYRGFRYWRIYSSLRRRPHYDDSPSQLKSRNERNRRKLKNNIWQMGWGRFPDQALSVLTLRSRPVNGQPLLLPTQLASGLEGIVSQAHRYRVGDLNFVIHFWLSKSHFWCTPEHGTWVFPLMSYCDTTEA